MNLSLSFPCYCCSKPTRGDTAYYVITTDGSNYMSFSSWLLYCANHDYNPADPTTAYDTAGCGWRPEAYGSTCYKKTKASEKIHTEIITKGGVKWLFIG